MSVRIKICCIQSVEELDLAQSFDVEAVGLVGPMPSGPGTLDDSAIKGILSARPKAKSVLLTSEREVEAVCAHVVRTRPKVLQLVDQVDPGVVASLRVLFPDLVIWQVIHVEDERALFAARQAAKEVDAVLLDSGSPSAALKTLGGTGRVHNWDISAEIVRALDVPVWLAGGLGAHNVADAIAHVRPYGVDVCSGLRPDGALDPALLAQFVKEVQTAS